MPSKIKDSEHGPIWYVTRRAKFMPGGVPRWVRIYDNGGTDKGGTIDRYTAVFTGRYSHLTAGGETWVLVMNGRPYHPQGFCQHCPRQGRPDRTTYGHLGKKIEFVDLPRDCQCAVLQDYMYLWDLLSPEDDAEASRQTTMKFLPIKRKK